jgi:hypothetical protein
MQLYYILTFFGSYLYFIAWRHAAFISIYHKLAGIVIPLDVGMLAAHIFIGMYRALSDGKAIWLVRKKPSSPCAFLSRPMFSFSISDVMVYSFSSVSPLKALKVGRCRLLNKVIGCFYKEGSIQPFKA